LYDFFEDSSNIYSSHFLTSNSRVSGNGSDLMQSIWVSYTLQLILLNYISKENQLVPRFLSTCWCISCRWLWQRREGSKGLWFDCSQILGNHYNYQFPCRSCLYVIFSSLYGRLIYTMVLIFIFSAFRLVIMKKR